MVRFLKMSFAKFRGYYKRSRTSSIASTSFLAPGVQILGLKHVLVGDYCTIGENTVFTINTKAEAGIKLRIGNNVYIGRNNFFTVGHSSEIGAYSVFGNNCSLISSDHIFETPLKPYLLTGATEDKRTRIGVNCWLGYNVSVVGNVSIGHGSIVGANAVVLKDLPPFCIAVGNPAKVIKRFNFNSSIWEKGESIVPSEYLDEEKYLDHLRKHFEILPLSFHSSSRSFGDI